MMGHVVKRKKKQSQLSFNSDTHKLCFDNHGLSYPLAQSLLPGNVYPTTICKCVELFYIVSGK